ncbi:AIR synthase family protein [Ruminiclostridium cellulolyticum]|uniref:AIR synthase related protein domain protein n=1 Tax=Ruminiclostridium cellulolyticum (strain ATCC 35319 / DSM 5812 / JCM 6584 / H10) TaxID=394503 RepID=B8I2N9_RUMCH|nr:AIR synthase family protein [Ruminiclostridium cellulolyticum]ACL76032.1 AIR synthase related protein domain protein [Ruminiclostridium cellulolyticum H10]
MEPGKLPNDILNKIVFGKINTFRKEVIMRPGIGEDCAAIEFDKYACVMSTDPITAAGKNAGRLAVHISCNDIASSGVEPLGLMVTILCPVGTTETELEHLMDQVCETAGQLNVEIIGGHTEVTPAVNKIILSTTCVGKSLKDKIISSSGAKPGDSVILTKSAGLEGTAIIAGDFEEELAEVMNKNELQYAKSLINAISVVPEGVLAGRFGVTSMHDITEGGVLGAAWEIAEASSTGVTIKKDSIPVEPVTRHICDHFGINPLRLISSGCMIITCKDGEGLVRLLGENNIKASIIGTITQNKTGRLLISEKEGTSENIEAPGADELYKIIK